MRTSSQQRFSNNFDELICLCSGISVFNSINVNLEFLLMIVGTSTTTTALVCRTVMTECLYHVSYEMLSHSNAWK